MTEQQRLPFFQRSWAQAMTWAFGIIAVIATVVPLFRGPTTSLTASYRKVPFIVPQFVKNKGAIDTALTQRDKLLRTLYSELQGHLDAKQLMAMPDSLRPSSLTNPRGLYDITPIAEFSIMHSGLCVLLIKNEGEKSIPQLQVVHPSDDNIYYEFKDSDGLLHRGKSVGKFPVGDLVATETREVYLWTRSASDYSDSRISIAYQEGIVQATSPVEVTGLLAWLSRHPLEIEFLSIIIICLLAYFVVTKFASSDTNAVEPAVDNEEAEQQKSIEQLDRLLDPNQSKNSAS